MCLRPRFKQGALVLYGAGIIGANLGFEMSKAGYSTLNIDKLPAAGYGSTGASCGLTDG